MAYKILPLKRLISTSDQLRGELFKIKNLSNYCDSAFGENRIYVSLCIFFWSLALSIFSLAKLCFNYFVHLVCEVIRNKCQWHKIKLFVTNICYSIWFYLIWKFLFYIITRYGWYMYWWYIYIKYNIRISNVYIYTYAHICNI